jgi:hypothetical protein
MRMAIFRRDSKSIDERSNKKKINFSSVGLLRIQVLVNDAIAGLQQNNIIIISLLPLSVIGVDKPPIID